MVLAVNLIGMLFSAYSICLIGRTFLELLLGPHHPVTVFLRRITEPVLAPIRRYIPPLQSGGAAWDLSPMVALLLLWIVERALRALLLGLS